MYTKRNIIAAYALMARCSNSRHTLQCDKEMPGGRSMDIASTRLKGMHRLQQGDMLTIGARDSDDSSMSVRPKAVRRRLRIAGIRRQSWRVRRPVQWTDFDPRVEGHAGDRPCERRGPRQGSSVRQQISKAPFALRQPNSGRTAWSEARSRTNGSVRMDLLDRA